MSPLDQPRARWDFTPEPHQIVAGCGAFGKSIFPPGTPTRSYLPALSEMFPISGDVSMEDLQQILSILIEGDAEYPCGSSFCVIAGTGEGRRRVYLTRASTRRLVETGLFTPDDIGKLLNRHHLDDREVGEA